MLGLGLSPRPALLPRQVSSAGNSSLPGEVGHREDDQSPPPLSLPCTFLSSPHPVPRTVGASACSEVGLCYREAELVWS